MSDDQKEKRMKENENTVLVGKKPVMTYVLACITQFESHKEVTIKARGNAISRAVDVAEITTKRFVENAKVKKIGIDTEEVISESGEKLNVSSIEITLAKKK